MERHSEITNAYETFKGPILRHPNKNAPWLIFLHGFPDDSSTWSLQIEALKEEFQIWAPDLYSHSYSDQVNGVAEFLKETSNACLIGHDIGGPVACEIARRFPDRVSKIFLINTLSLGLFVKRWKKPRQWMKSSYMSLFIGPMHKTGWWKKFSGLFMKTAYDLGEVGAQDPIRKNSPAVLEGIKRYREMAKTIPEQIITDKIKIETHFLFGARDAFLLPPQKDEMKNHFQQYTVETLSAGHWPQRTHADEVNEWIKRMV